jgi:hypothetical protein
MALQMCLRHGEEGVAPGGHWPLIQNAPYVLKQCMQQGIRWALERSKHSGAFRFSRVEGNKEHFVQPLSRTRLSDNLRPIVRSPGCWTTDETTLHSRRTGKGSLSTYIPFFQKFKGCSHSMSPTARFYAQRNQLTTQVPRGEQPIRHNL